MRQLSEERIERTDKFLKLFFKLMEIGLTQEEYDLFMTRFNQLRHYEKRDERIGLIDKEGKWLLNLNLSEIIERN